MTRAERRAYRRLAALADRLEPALARQWLAALDELVRTVPATALVAALEAGGPDALVSALFDRPEARLALQSLATQYADAVARAVPVAAAGLPPIGRLRVAIPVASPALVDAVRRWEQTAFRRVAAEMREGVRTLVADGIVAGLGPRGMVASLRQPTGAIGLTAYDHRIVASFREQLRTDPATALRRALRDRRFDRTVRRGALTDAQIDRMTAAYRQKLITWRAQTFARSAAVSAANDASVVAWSDTLRAAGIDEALVRRYWVVADDERLCEVCGPVPAMQPTGVGLREAFRTPDGTAMQPPLHPNCRCMVWVRIVDAATFRTAIARPLGVAAFAA